MECDEKLSQLIPLILHIILPLTDILEKMACYVYKKISFVNVQTK